MSNATMTGAELTNHLREIMRTKKIAEHLREVHGFTETPKTLQAQHTAHQKAHADQKSSDAASQKDASVLSGVTRKPEETKAAPKPAAKARTPKAPATKAAPKPSATKSATRTAPKPATAKAPARTKAAPKPETAPAESNGNGSARSGNQDLAKRLVDLVAANFGDLSRDEQEKIANWLKVLPTGGRAHERYWPANFARPTTADWRKPE